MRKILPITQLEESRPWTNLERAVAVGVGVLVLFHCLAVIGFSARHGRLAMVPIYDDLTYLIDGINRLDAFDKHGFTGLAASFLQSAPHAPYSSLLATFGFELTPKEMVGAYALSSIWVVVFLALLQRLVRDLPRATQMGLLIASLSLPMLATVIGSFRPDTYWGLITGTVTVILATCDIDKATRIEMVFSGLLIGAAALSKPTGMPAGCLVMAIGYFTALAVALTRKTAPQVMIRTIFIKTVFMMFGVAIIVAPYLIVGGRDLMIYIYTAMVKNSAVWRFDGPLTAHLGYYLQPDLLFGAIGWLAFAGPLFFLSAAVGAGLSRNSASITRTIGVCACVLVAYAVPTISPVKSPFIGSLFYGTFIAAAFWCLAISIKPVPRLVVLVLGVAVFASFWRPSVPLVSLEGAAYATVDKASRTVTPPVLELLADGAAQGQILSVYTSSPGPVFDATIQYEALLNGISATFVGDYTNPDWRSILMKAQRADIVIASETGAIAQGGGFAYPGIQYQDRLIAALAADPAWRELTTFIDEAGFSTVVFTRFAPRTVKLSFGAGFRQTEGPLPEQRLPQFHWMIADTARLTVLNIDDAEKEFGLQCESISDVDLTVQDPAGHTIATKKIHARVATGTFDTVDVRLSAEAIAPVRLLLKVNTSDLSIGPWPGAVLCAASTVVGAAEKH